MMINNKTHKIVHLKPGQPLSDNFKRDHTEYKTRKDHHEGNMFSIEQRATIKQN